MSTYILDVSGFIHRAYHASKANPLYTADGVPCAAVDLFRKMLSKLRYEQQPGKLLAACDSIGPSFRTAIFPAYKITRAATPDDLTAQRPGIAAVLTDMGIPTFAVTGFEADDIIGTLVEKHAGESLCIVTGDKDMCQLVGPGVSVFNPSKGVLLDTGGVTALMGVPPNQVVDLLALEGDVSDNVPGAPGIGPKGALEIVKKYGTVENAIAQADRISNRRYRKALQESREQILMSKQLVTIRRDVPLNTIVEW